MKYKREISAVCAFALLLAAVALVAPGFFSLGNLRDLALNNASALLIAAGMTVVILSGQIDISVGSQFAIYSVVSASLAKSGVPLVLALPLVLTLGAAMGAFNGFLVGKLRLPSIVVTLAMLVALRDALRWITQGAWVQDLPPNFQWFGLGQNIAQLLIVATALGCTLALGWALRNLQAGRSFYAVGSDAEAARLIGLNPARVVFNSFVLMGLLTALGAVLNAARFSSVPPNSGAGLELKAIAAVIVGGTSIAGGRGTMLGTLIGAALLGTVGTALTFVGINPFWEKAIQGLIILAALGSDVFLQHVQQFRQKRITTPNAHAAD